MEKSVFLKTDTYCGPLLILRHPKSRRFRLRIDRKRHLPVLVLSKRASEKNGVLFAVANAGWIQKQMEKLPTTQCFEDSMMLMLFGKNVKIHHAPTAKRGVWLEQDVIWVSGHAEHLHRRVTDFIKKEMKIIAGQRVRFWASVLNVNAGKISIKDTKSRWGSCNRKGDISLSWRLSLAPSDVMDYVIVHELCHILEMNHSERFWKIVSQTIPDYKQSELWLRRNADFLYCFTDCIIS